MVERILSPAFLVILSSQAFGTVPIIVIYLALAAILLKTRPYKGTKANYRPLANYSIVFLISLIMLGIAFSADPEGALSQYGPFLVLILLLVCVVYSIVALVKELKEKHCSKK